LLLAHSRTTRRKPTKSLRGGIALAPSWSLERN
jgi:hypothetical protein